MINCFVTIIKLAKLNVTAQKLTDSLLRDFPGSGNAYCRNCRSSNIHKRCCYSRKLTDLENGKLVDVTLKTIRFECGGCHTSHAFLVPLVIPYCHHSVPVVIRALYEYFETNAATAVSEKYQITPSTLYHWRDLFLRHKTEWLGALKDAETEAVVFLKNLIENVEYSQFVKEFMQGRSDHKAFMQNHKNADNHRFV